MNEVLTIDIGNTKAKYAVFHDKNIVESHVFNPLSDDLTLLLQRYPIINKGKQTLEQLQNFYTLMRIIPLKDYL